MAISSNNPESVRLDEMGYTDLGDSFDDMKQRAKDKKYNFSLKIIFSIPITNMP